VTDVIDAIGTSAAMTACATVRAAAASTDNTPVALKAEISSCCDASTAAVAVASSSAAAAALTVAESTAYAATGMTTMPNATAMKAIT
jgi:hypothetical protein